MFLLPFKHHTIVMGLSEKYLTYLNYVSITIELLQKNFLKIQL